VQLTGAAQLLEKEFTAEKYMVGHLLRRDESMTGAAKEAVGKLWSGSVEDFRKASLDPLLAIKDQDFGYMQTTVEQIRAMEDLGSKTVAQAEKQLRGIFTAEQYDIFVKDIGKDELIGEKREDVAQKQLLMSKQYAANVLLPLNNPSGQMQLQNNINSIANDINMIKDH